MNKRGFTLIEILISFSIVAVITALLYGTFRSTIKTAEAVDKDADAYRVARIVVYQLTKDLSMLHQVALVHGSSFSASSATPFGALQLVGENKSRFIDGANYPDDTISFVSLSSPPVLQGFAVADRAEIAYSLSESSLMRKIKFRNKPVENEVGDLVLGLNFRYYDNTKKEWLDEWDPRVTTGIPLAMEVTLTLKGASPFRTTVGIPLSGTL